MYLSQEKQAEMIILMNKYIELNQGGANKTRETDIIIEKFFRYVDPLILGVIYTPKYKFWRFAEIDDLVQEARIALLISINKQQWDPARGTIFNFFTTVISRNLINFTRKHKKKAESDTDIDTLYNNEDIKYNQDFDKEFIMNDIFKELRNFFSGKKKFLELTELLEIYYNDNLGKKFIKKQFIEFAKAYNFSPAITNTFFAYMKKLTYSHNEDIQELLRFNQWDKH